MRLSRPVPGLLDLSWLVPPGVASSHVYVGSLAALQGGVYDHAEAGACSLAGDQVLIGEPLADVYFLVVGDCGNGFQSPAGRDSLDVPRPAADPACP